MSTKMRLTFVIEVPTDLVDEGTNEQIDRSYDKVAMEASERSHIAETALREAGTVIVSVDVDVAEGSQVDVIKHVEE